MGNTRYCVGLLRSPSHSCGNWVYSSRRIHVGAPVLVVWWHALGDGDYHVCYVTAGTEIRSARKG